MHVCVYCTVLRIDFVCSKKTLNFIAISLFTVSMALGGR